MTDAKDKARDAAETDQTSQQVTEREAFEKWYRERFSVPDHIKPDWDCMSKNDELRFEGWQARVQHAQQAVESEREITNHEEAFALANLKRHESNLARCYLDLVSRAAKPAVPDGYAIVPVEPTLDMGWAYIDAKGGSFNHDGYRAMLSAAPPLPVAQGVPDIGAIWEQAICEVEAGIKLAELRPNQIPGLFQILRRNVEAKLEAAPKEPT